MGSNKIHNNISLHFKQNYNRTRNRTTRDEIEKYELEIAKEKNGDWNLEECEKDIKKQISEIMEKVNKNKYGKAIINN